MTRPVVPLAVVVAGRWLDRRSEPAFVVRSLAGAASRSGPVAVLVPGLPGQRGADGAFDLESLGPPGALRWPGPAPRGTTVIVDELTADVVTLLQEAEPDAVLFLSATDAPPHPSWHRLQLVGGDDPIGVHVPVNRLAERHRHHGFGFTDYLLVLSDRTGDHPEPPPAAAWASAAFTDADVVVVENAVASAWRGRALRGAVSVDTRTDLWRLLAHANVCIDLAPGPLVARECVEALRFGTPIVVPDGSGPGAMHARSSGGATFRDESELLEAVAAFRNSARRAEVANLARSYSDAHYGDPDTLVRRLREVLARQPQVR